MSDQFVAEIRIVPFNFPPTGWAFCNGQLLPLSQNTALFALLGTVYGGDGKSTFALPNMQDSAPMHPGQGQGLSDRVLGEQSGEQFVTLLTSEIPAHSHTVRGSSNPADTGEVAGNSWGLGQNERGDVDAYQTAQNTTMAPTFLSLAGGSLPHNNMMPYLTLNFIIALQGIFPPRS